MIDEELICEEKEKDRKLFATCRIVYHNNVTFCAKNVLFSISPILDILLIFYKLVSV